MIPSADQWQSALQERHGKALQEKFSAATVAICGLGGLGSNIAISLARAGIGKLILIDFDRVDITNLHRQQYKACQIGLPKTQALSENLLEIAPYLSVETHCVRVTEENAVSLLQNADVLCEAFDKAECKSMLMDVACTHFPNKYLVTASGMAGLGSPNTIHTRQLTKRIYLCGDEVSDVTAGLGLVAPRVALCAAHQAQTVLRILAGELNL